jgi:hypothetical protein
MNWDWISKTITDLTAGTSWQTIGYILVALIAYYERQMLKDFASGALNKGKKLFKKATKEVKASVDPEPNETVDAFAHLMKVRSATEHDKRARQCIRYLGALLAQPPEPKPEVAQ